MNNTREAWERVTAKRQEHQTAAGLQDTAQATQDDHRRAGMEWINAVCAEYDMDPTEVLETMNVASGETTPNLRALVLVTAIPVDALPEACFGAGYLCGMAVGLELARSGVS